MTVGANPNARDSNRMTPLHCAAASGGTCKRLIDAQAKVDAADINGHTPLYRALYTNDNPGCTRVQPARTGANAYPNRRRFLSPPTLRASQGSALLLGWKRENLH